MVSAVAMIWMAAPVPWKMPRVPPPPPKATQNTEWPAGTSYVCV
jgi:hypothetical protein